MRVVVEGIHHWPTNQTPPHKLLYLSAFSPWCEEFIRLHDDIWNQTLQNAVMKGETISDEFTINVPSNKENKLVSNKRIQLSPLKLINQCD